MNKKSRTNLTVVAFLFGVAIILTMFLTYYNQNSIELPKDLVSVQSEIGCIKTIHSESEFNIVQNFTGKVLGYQLARCS